MTPTKANQQKPTKEKENKTMTNAMIIFNASQELAENGVIAYTGRTAIMTLPDGTPAEYKETEQYILSRNGKRPASWYRKDRKRSQK